ncbi:MAG: mandelate racemase/muconate lactonizing enzyme family protein [Verrucomicrobia bacterium]|nr:mandelate racemase/muconate lactonizing enzyme family protein [Verrucomicrobiota bacterium]MDA1068944.1 mandelate racemase/muconate lactonizing enzyme family protein [Verrucomicrobiota bacterium]
MIANTRRNFLKKSVFGGVALGGMFAAPLDQVAAAATSNVKRDSSPSALKITDLRYIIVKHLGRPCPILRMDTNQDIYGYGEVRDGGEVKHALMLKHLLLGKNPCNVEMLFQLIKPFGDHGRLGGGVSGVEMALWDLVGKAYEVPVWQLLGGRYRDKVRLYADTHGDTDYDLIKSKVKTRVEDQGYTWLKMTRVGNVLKDVPGIYQAGSRDQLSDKGIGIVANYLQMIRDTVGADVEISVDHFVGRNLENMTRQGNALERSRLAWIEEPIKWTETEQLKALRNAINTPIATGEDMFARESFRVLCDSQAVDFVHPDMATAGGILETKKIGDYAEDHGIRQALHYAGTPVSFMANVHCAAATRNCAVLEYHPEGEEIPEWTGMVSTLGGQPLVSNGFAPVPESPGLGIELNMEHIKTVLHPDDKSIFASTAQWNDKAWE